MSNHRPEVLLGDIAEKITVGHVGPMATRYVEDGVPFLRSQNVRRLSLDLTDVKYIPPDFHRQLAKSRLRPGDVVVVRTGEPGACAVIPIDLPDANCADLVIVRPGRDLDARFVAYYINEAAAHHVASHLVGAVQQHFNVGAARALPIKMPHIDEQRAIAGVLGSLDDKVEQNRRTSRALERLAGAIFRAWFVDFDPVHAKAAGATSFPSMPQDVFDSLPTTFTPSDLGPIPEGWDVKPATDVATVAIGKTPPRKEPQWFSLSSRDVPWASIADMGNCGTFISATSEYVTPDAVERFNIRRIPDGSVLYSFKLTVGRVAICDGEITSNEAIAHFIPHPGHTIGSEYLYCYLRSFDSSNLGSTSSIATATNSRAVKAMPVLVPDDPTAEAFTQQAAPMFDVIRSLNRESRKLAELRDYLLPKLLSGEVRVSDAARLAESVA